MKVSNYLLRSGLALLGLTAACASVAAPHQRVNTAQSAVRSADEAGAGRIPSAALHLQLAREEMDEAQKLMGHGRNERADYVLRRAQADAELALALAHEAPARVAAQDAIDRLNNLQPTQIP